jgi:hypothetical protein
VTMILFFLGMEERCCCCCCYCIGAPLDCDEKYYCNYENVNRLERRKRTLYDLSQPLVVGGARMIIGDGSIVVIGIVVAVVVVDEMSA